MSKTAKFTQFIRQKLLTKNRLILINEDTFEEKFSFQLNLMNVFVLIMISSISLIAMTTYIIAFTPLREYIPGYASSELKKNAVELALKSEQLEKDLQKNQAYIESVQKLLRGELEYAVFDKDSIAAKDAMVETFKMKTTKDELKLREQVDREDKFNLFEKAASKVSLVFFSPVKGIITDGFNAKKKHFAVDVAVPKDTPIKSVANGTVVFADWTPSTGNTIIIKHREGILSVYKHAALLTKTQGDVVKSAEVIGLAGNSGSETTGVHLHFELWKDGFPIDPTQFINFE